MSVPRTEFAPDEVLYLQVAVSLTAPQPVLGSNTETYTFNFAALTTQFSSVAPLRYEFPRTAADAPEVPHSQATRQHAAFRRIEESVEIEAAPSRIADMSRQVDDAVEEPLEVSVRQATFPRTTTQDGMSPEDQAVRQAIFRRVNAEEYPVQEEVSRRVTAVRRLAQGGVGLDATANKQVTYGRRALQFLQPGEDPVIDPTREIRVVVRNSDGLLHGPGALVVLFRTDTNFPVQTGVSDGASEVVFPRNSFDSASYFVAAWDTDGTPLPTQAVSERGLIPEAV